MALQLLHEVFPHLSLKSIAEAYDAAGGSVDAAAEALQQRLQILGDEEMSKQMQRAEDEMQQLAGAGSCPSPKMAEGGKWVAVKSKSPHAEPEKKATKKKHHRKKRSREACEEPKQGEGVEEFLVSKLGSAAGIGRDVIRDVINHCDGNVQKSLDCLMLLTGESSTGFGFEKHAASFSKKEAAKNNLECAENHTTKGKESSYQILANQVRDQENWKPQQDDLKKLSSSFPGIDMKALEEVLKASDYSYSAAVSCLVEAGLDPVAAADLPRQACGSLFKSSGGPEHDDREWQAVKTKIKPEKKNHYQVLDGAIAAPPYDDWENYDRQHELSREHFSKMKQCFTQAAVAYSNGHRNQAAFLSQKGREHKQLARDARDKASDDVFRLRNKQQENNITIDLHNQQVHEALKLLNLHLKTLAILPSVHTLTVITGCGNHAPNGKPKLKPVIISFMKARKLVWSELNPGCLQINLQSG